MNERTLIDPTCRCKGTGWVKATIPAQFRHEYRGMSWGWAGCDEHYMQADPEPPPDVGGHP